MKPEEKSYPKGRGIGRNIFKMNSHNCQKQQILVWGAGRGLGRVLVNNEEEKKRGLKFPRGTLQSFVRRGSATTPNPLYGTLREKVLPLLCL